MKKIIIFGLLVCLLASSVSAVKTHNLVFYLHPDLVDDLNSTKVFLEKYVLDLNYILAKNTDRQLIFNPDTGIILTDTKPHTGTAGILPTEGYEVWAHVGKSNFSFSYGGYMSFDISGAAVLAGLKWKQIYDPDTLIADTNEMKDYWIQLDHMLHEYAHIYGAGISEYYNLNIVDDNTNELPTLDIRLSDPNDSYWKERTNYFADPLLQNIYGKSNVGNPTSRSELLETALFSDLTSAIMQGDFRSPTIKPPMPNLNNISIKVYDSKTLLPIQNAQVKIWNIRSFSPYYNELKLDNSTDDNGEILFTWDGSVNSNYNHLRLIKVYKNGYQPKAQYVSKFDAEFVSNVEEKSHWEIEIYIENNNQVPIANAGFDQELIDSDNDGNEIVILNGSKSMDPDGNIVSYEWKEENITLGFGEVLEHNFSIGTHLISLTVTDDGGLTATDNVLVEIIKKPNQVPIANAGFDQELIDSDNSGNEIVILNGSGSMDPDGNIVSYEWKEENITLGFGEVLEHNFSIGAHLVSLTVTDDGGLTATDNVSIEIIPQVDIINILNARYNDKSRRLKVEAISDNPLAVLTLVGYDEMIYKKGKWIYNNKNVNDPGSLVTVISSLGGSSTSSVTH